jgi:hypothetical protein
MLKCFISEFAFALLLPSLASRGDHHKTDSATPSNKPMAAFDPIEGRSRELTGAPGNYDL